MNILKKYLRKAEYVVNNAYIGYRKSKIKY
ncbi:MAG: hypothetical protein JWQ66_2910 [Mucilaginibacter sp.]|nr:hypothetical protein [Mucilaginibacter sp.]